MKVQLQHRVDILLFILLFAGMSFALYMALIGAPTERTMGDIQRIFYFHVPAAITGLTAFALNFVASLMYVFRKNRWWDTLALSSAETGILFFCMLLITGPMWAKPVWFVWWTWSPRLTSAFVLCLLYAVYMLIRKSFEEPESHGCGGFRHYRFCGRPAGIFLHLLVARYSPVSHADERKPGPVYAPGVLYLYGCLSGSFPVSSSPAFLSRADAEQD